MEINKLFGYCVFDVYIVNSNTIRLVSSGRGLLYNIVSKSIEYKSVYLPNTAIFVVDRDLKRALLSDTSGKCSLLDIKTNEKIKVFSLKYEPGYHSIISVKNDFFYVSFDGSIFKIDVENNVMQVSIDKINTRILYISHILEDKFILVGEDFKNKLTYVFICNLSSDKFIVSESIEITDSHPELPTIQMKVNNGNVFLPITKPFGKGCREVIVKIDLSSKSVVEFLSPKDYQESDDGYYREFDFSPNDKLLAIAFVDALKIIDLETMKIIQTCRLEFISGVKWIDNKRCVVSTWKGLFEIIL